MSQWHSSHASPPLFSAHPSRVSRPHRSSAEGPSGAVRMRPRHSFRHTPHTFRGPIGSSAEGPSGRVRMPSSRQFRHTPHALRAPIRSSTEGPSGKARMRARANSGTPFTRFVAP